MNPQVWYPGIRCKLFAVGLTTALLFSGCQKIEQFLAKRSASGVKLPFGSTELIYQTTATELRLAQSSKPYLVFNIPANALELRLKGAVVLRTPLNLVEVEPTAVSKFVEQFTSDTERLVRQISGKYLFASQQQTPDSVLTVVGEVINVKPELMQREIPSRFRLLWADNLILDIVSDAQQVKSESVETKLHNTMMQARYVLRRPFGATLLVIKVKPDDAITLYRVTEPGTPTLLDLIPPNTQIPDKIPATRKKR
jgi:hypothetical protein